jgi:pimeloyl-ACP methyl ester carboxylesterase
MSPVNKTFTLSTGQTFGYLEMGNPKGPGCVFFHGFPGSSRQILVIRHLEVFEKFRVIAVDRPGFGDSSFSPKRNIVEIADLVGELTEHLGLPKFHLIGVSGGAPSAFIVGDRLRSRVLSLTSICGLGPLYEPVFFERMSSWEKSFLLLARFSPFMASRILGKAHAELQKGRLPPRERMLRLFPPEDVDVISNAEIRAVFRESMGHAFKQGSMGVAVEMKVFQQDWKIQDWKFPFPVHLWHGEKDTLVPPEHSRFLHERIGGSHLHMLETEGHYSLPILRIEEILKPIL